MNLDDVRRNPFCLDRLDLKTLNRRPSVIVTNELFSPLIGEVPVRFIALPAARWLPRWAAALVLAARLVLEMRRRDTVGLVSLGNLSGSFFCFLSSFGWLRGGPVLAYRALLPVTHGRLRAWLIRRVLRGATLIAVWSRSQIESYHRAFGVPRDQFIFVPYKANHSKSPALSMPVGDYIFSGGNSERDYKTLFEAVQGLSVPVIVSTTKPAAVRGLAVPENVILVNAVEPAFKRLVASARVVVLCLKGDIIRGSGEATLLNAMWHGKPVVAADDVSASDYIEDGVDGFVVPAGSAEQVRRRLLELWEDPALAARVGEAARRKAAGFYTHDQWKTRMQVLAMLAFGREA
jgi:glycosyltransferase involved in cell wall biosynthesis